MRVLLDECVNPRLRHALAEFEVLTVVAAGWSGLLDGPLVSRVTGHIDVLVTIDKGFEFQQNLAKLKFGVVIIHVERNRMEHYRPLIADLIKAINQVLPGTVIHVRR